MAMNPNVQSIVMHNGGVMHTSSTRTKPTTMIKCATTMRLEELHTQMLKRKSIRGLQAQRSLLGTKLDTSTMRCETMQNAW